MAPITVTIQQLQAHIRHLLVQAGIPIKTITLKLQAMFHRVRTSNLKENFKFTSFLSLFREVSGAIGARLRGLFMRCGRLLHPPPTAASVIIETPAAAVVIAETPAIITACEVPVAAPVEEEPTCEITTLEQSPPLEQYTEHSSSTDEGSSDESSVRDSDSATSDISTAASEAAPLSAMQKHQQALASLVGAGVAQRILTLLDPAHVGYYRRDTGGMYTGPIEGKEAHREIHALLDVIYPKSPDRRDRVWRSTNYKTDEIWIGVPHSLPSKDKPMHKRQWALERERSDRKARQLQQVADITVRINREARLARGGDTAQDAPVTWGCFAANTNAATAAAQAANTPEAIKKRVADLEVSRANTPARTFNSTTFKLKGAKKEVAPKVTRSADFLPPHLKMRAQKEGETQ